MDKPVTVCHNVTTLKWTGHVRHHSVVRWRFFTKLQNHTRKTFYHASAFLVISEENLYLKKNPKREPVSCFTRLVADLNCAVIVWKQNKVMLIL